jgi:hypothetical protein
MKAVRDDIKDLKDGTAARLSVLEADRVTQKEFQDHEDRLRKVETAASDFKGRYAILAAIAAVVISAIVSYIIKHN